jgi:hypothetical protein
MIKELLLLLLVACFYSQIKPLLLLLLLLLLVTEAWGPTNIYIVYWNSYLFRSLID